MHETHTVSPSQRFIREALKIGAIELLPDGRPLKSGRSSPYFFNSGLFNTGHTLSALAQAYAASIHFHFQPEVLFGPAYKGIPLVAATAVALGNSVGYAFDRKEEKDHGEGGLLVGYPVNGKEVLIVDDVMTTGTSSGEAVEIIKANGGIPIGCVIAFDRQERGKESNLSAVQEFQQKYGIPVHSAATLADLIDYLQDLLQGVNNKQVPESVVLEKILVYREQYGVQQ